MGILDNASKLVGRGAAGLERTGKLTSLNAQLKELDRSRSTAMSKLGEALYPLFRLDSSIRPQNEALFAEIERLDQKIRELNLEKNQLGIQSDIASPATKVCRQCGSRLQEGDEFCRHCGAAYTIADQPSNADMSACPSCGSLIEPGYSFCTTCGARL